MIPHPLICHLIAIVACGVVIPGHSYAAPVDLTRVDFDQMIAGLPTRVESFDDFALGSHPSPLLLSNGSYSASNPVIVDTFIGNQLIEGNDLAGSRMFDLFPGTLFWGAEIRPASENLDMEVTVLGSSGTLLVTITPTFDGFFIGFHDPLGLDSVTFGPLQTGGSRANYGFLEVTTAVPEPGTLALLAFGMAALVIVHRRIR